MSVDTPETEGPLGTPKTRLEDNIKTESKEKFLRMERGRLGQSRDQRRDDLNRRLHCE